MNYELNDLIKNADMVRFVKSKRMAWLGHVMRIEGKIIPKRVLEWKPTGRREWICCFTHISSVGTRGG
jgi:hypothetical protein